MDSARFDTLTRSLTTAGSRRRALGSLFGGALGLLGWHAVDDADAHNASTACKKKSGKLKKKCLKKAKAHNATHTTQPPPPPISCQGKADLTDCGGGNKCSGGVCATEPTCFPAGTICEPPPAGETTPTCRGKCCTPSFIPPAKCTAGFANARCHTDSDCGSASCVGFVCQ